MNIVVETTHPSCIIPINGTPRTPSRITVFLVETGELNSTGNTNRR